MTTEEIKALKIPIKELSDISCVFVDSAILWINENTTLEYDPENMPEDLPANVKVFISKYHDVLNSEAREGVTSESIQGLSQSFATSSDRTASIWQYANMLLAPYLLSSVKAVQARNRWC